MRLPTPAATLRAALLVALLAWGALAGLRTVADFDLGWQIADARHPLASVDTLSYTAHGAPWIYPPLAGIVFRALFALGGYPAISWLCCAALLTTLALAAWRASLGTLVLLLVSVPTLAAQCIPRSGLFTVVLAALFARILFGSATGLPRTRALWLLAPLMALWVNLHTGFVAGLALVAAFGWLHRRSITRRQWAPLLATAAIAPLLNPWGPLIFRAIFAQEHTSPQQTSTVLELAPLLHSFSPQALLQPLSPQGAIWYLLLAVAAAVFLLVFTTRQYALAFLLAGATAVVLASARTQGVFIPLACLLAGRPLSRALRPLHPWLHAAPLAGLALAHAALGCSAWISGRAPVQQDQVTSFGAGPSWWLPLRAVAFVRTQHLPTQLFSTFNLSGFLAAQLGPTYPDFADARYLPFGDALIAQQLQLAATPLDSPLWAAAAARYGIRTVVFPTARFYGVGPLPLAADCASHTWAPVFLDTTGIVFVHADALPASVPRISCTQVALGPDANTPPGRLARYQALANAAVLHYLLGNSAAAERALDQAQALYAGDDDSLLLLRGQLAAQQNQLPAAEQALTAALQLHASDAASFQLGLVYARQSRYQEAAHQLEQAAREAQAPSFGITLALAQVRLLAGDLPAAFAALGQAEPLAAGSSQRAALYDLQAVALAQAGELTRAVAAEQQALGAEPAPQRWQRLAALLAATGNRGAAQAAEQHAQPPAAAPPPR